jgi:D-lactate dehydrogenase
LWPHLGTLQGIKGSCCGMIFNTRGLKGAATQMGTSLEASIVEASQNGMIPVVCDTSPCLAQIKTSLATSDLRCGATGPEPTRLDRP